MVYETQEKVTVILPTLIKQEVVKLKDELKVSMNSIYQTAIAEYVEKKRREQIRREAMEMVSEYNDNPEMKELSEFEEDIYEY
jgi:phage regulator Rha-like protein